MDMDPGRSTRMMIVRPIKSNDLNTLLGLAEESGAGLTSLPNSKPILQKKIQRSLQSFSEKEIGLFLFVLEDTETGHVVGCCAIDAAVGSPQEPLYSYRVTKLTHRCPGLEVYQDHQVLHLANDYNGVSELCTLYLTPSYRKGLNGRLLSQSRLLFLAQHQHLFSEHVIAEMRGVSNEDGYSPFWKHLGKHFFGMDFTKADFLNACGDKQFIADLMPKHPIYATLLPKTAQKVIGKTHQLTRPAASILKKEGFTFAGYIDIFDGGPTLEAPARQIKTVKHSSLVTIKETCHSIDEKNPYFLIANLDLEFRSCIARLVIDDAKKHVTISDEVLSMMNLSIGDTIRIIAIPGKKS